MRRSLSMLFIGFVLVSHQTPVIAGPEYDASADTPSETVPVLYKLHGRVDGAMLDSFEEWVAARKAQGATSLDIEVNSGGGSVFDGIKISQAIERARVPSYCTVDGMAASMAFFILQSCTFRFMTKRSVLMAHEPSASMSGGGNSSEFGNITAFLRVLTRAMAEHCAARLRITVKQYMDLTASGKEWWLVWDDAMRFGAVDLAVSPRHS